MPATKVVCEEEQLGKKQFSWSACSVGAWRNEQTMKTFSALDSKQAELVKVRGARAAVVPQEEFPSPPARK